MSVFIAETLFNPDNGHTYHLIEGQVTAEKPLGGISWSEAHAFSQTLSTNDHSAALVSINDGNEQAWVNQNFSYEPGDPSSHQLIWIGLSDQTTEGMFEWVNGEALGHENWAANSPINLDGSEDFSLIVNTAIFDPFLPQNSWTNYHDSELFQDTIPFSALIEVSPVPEPGAVVFFMVVPILLFRRIRNVF